MGARRRRAARRARRAGTTRAGRCAARGGRGRGGDDRRVRQLPREHGGPPPGHHAPGPDPLLAGARLLLAELAVARDAHRRRRRPVHDAGGGSGRLPALRPPGRLPHRRRHRRPRRRQHARRGHGVDGGRQLGAGLHHDQRRHRARGCPSPSCPPPAAPPTPRRRSTRWARPSAAPAPRPTCSARSRATPTSPRSSSWAATGTAGGRGARSASPTRCRRAAPPTSRGPTARSSRFIDFGGATRPTDMHGWPTFVDWPSPTALAEEGDYYTGIERAWKAGLRLMVTDLVDNEALCSLMTTQPQPVQRHGRGQDPERGPVRAAGLHRRPVGRTRQGLVPHRHRSRSRRAG